eukprot:scaffold79741_cov50-Phaeocystis_antarctica.AAC.2
MCARVYSDRHASKSRKEYRESPDCTHTLFNTLVSKPLVVGAQRLRDRAVAHGAGGGRLRLGAIGAPDLVRALPQQY